MSTGTFFAGVVSSAFGKAYEYMTPLVSSEAEEKKTELQRPDISKVVESISSLGYLALLSMEKKNTKIGVQNNKIIFYPPKMMNLQGWDRWGVAGKSDLKKYQILEFAVMIPQTWYEPGSDEAKAICRIQKIALHGINSLKETYQDTYVPHYINGYITKITFFERQNQAISSSSLEELSEVDGEKRRSDASSESFDEVIEIDPKMSELMKGLWSKADLIGLAEKLERAHKDFESANNSLPQSKKNVKALLDIQVKEFQQKLHEMLSKMISVSSQNSS